MTNNNSPKDANNRDIFNFTTFSQYNGEKLGNFLTADNRLLNKD
jgi:hypothetical protein